MTKDEIPAVASWFQDGFHRFLQPLFRRSFHTIALERESSKVSCPAGEPLIVFANHASWWDPLVAHFLNRSIFPDRQFYAPIDASALEQYRVFGKLGFYGVDMESNRGAAKFLKLSNSIMNSGETAIWMTPEGKFTDVRDQNTPLKPGLAHLCSRTEVGWALPVALEYVFWDEKLPVCLAMFGKPIRLGEGERDKKQWNECLTQGLRTTQSHLAELAIARSADPFDHLLKGKRGAGFIYDSFRRAKSLLTGKRFRASHGEQFE